MSLQFGSTERGKSLLLYGGHEYVERSREPWMTQGISYWRCRHYRKHKCSGSMQTEGDSVTKEPGVHTHSGDPVTAQVQQVVSTLHSFAEDSSDSVRNCVANSVTSATCDVMQRLPSKSSLERSVRRKRQRTDNAREIPHTRNFDIPPEYQEIILHDSGVDDVDRIICMGDINIVTNLSGNSKLWMCDGTFETTPILFYQLYTIHAKVGSNYPPCIYFLLPNKTQATYERMIDILLSVMPGLQPEKVLTDFETAAINAFRKKIPSASTSGCFFHLSQCVIRKIASVGLKARYENDRDFSVLMKCLPALAFVPEDDVITVFEELVLTLPQEPEVEEVVAYFESNYIRGMQIGGRRRDPRFPIKLWNHFEDAEECAPKTTNCCEGFHNALKSVYMCAHPTMWKFLKGIARDIAVQRLVHQNALVHRCDAPTNKYIKLAQRLATKIKMYRAEVDKLLYLRAVANMQVV